MEVDGQKQGRKRTMAHASEFQKMINVWIRFRFTCSEIFKITKFNVKIFVLTTYMWELTERW
jgi:hypothetical protein